METTAVELTTMARTAAIELAQAPNGTAVVNALITRLWRAGGYMALEASQISWECREVAAVRAGVVPILQQMADVKISPCAELPTPSATFGIEALR
jgi:hypothetical protein